MSGRDSRSDRPRPSVDELLKRYGHRTSVTSSGGADSSSSNKITVSSGIGRGAATSNTGTRPSAHLGGLGSNIKMATSYGSSYRRHDIATSVPGQRQTLDTPSYLKGSASTQVGGTRLSSRAKAVEKTEGEEGEEEEAEDIRFTGRTDHGRSQPLKRDALGAQAYTLGGGESRSQYSSGSAAMLGVGGGVPKREGSSPDRTDYDFRKEEDFRATGGGGGVGGVSGATKPPELHVDQHDSMDSQGRFNSDNSSGDLISYQRQPFVWDSQQAISMGSKAKLVPGGGELDVDSRPSSYRMDASQGKIMHDAKLTTGTEPVSALTPEGSVSESGGVKLYGRSVSTPARKHEYGEGEETSAHGGRARRELIGKEEYSSQAVGDEDGQVSRMLLLKKSINASEIRKSLSHTSSSSESRDENSKRLSFSSQSSVGSKVLGLDSWPMNAQGCVHIGNCYSPKAVRAEIEEMKKQQKAQLKRKDLEFDGLKREKKTLEKELELLKKDYNKESDSYFDEITTLTEQLTANQVEVGKLKLDVTDYEELKRRSQYLEEQAHNATETIMQLQRENAELMNTNIQGTEEGTANMARQRFSEPVQGQALAFEKMRLQEEKEREKAASLQKELEEMAEKISQKEDVIKKLKDRVNTLTTQLTQGPADVKLHLPSFPDVGVDIEKHRHHEQLEDEVVGPGERVEELKADNQRLRMEIQGWETKCAELQAKFEELMVHSANVAKHSKVLKESLEDKELTIKILKKENESLEADTATLNDLLSKSDKDMTKLRANLQESEKERAEWEIRAGRLEQLVEEARQTLDSQTKDLTDSKKQLHELMAQLELERNSKAAMDQEKKSLADEVSLHQTRAMIFEQDFQQERQDREQAHSKFLEMEERYKHQLEALSNESQKIMDELQRQKKAYKDMEGEYQARLSQQSYASGEKDRRAAMLEERNRELEGDIATKTQQLKQYKKQADHLRDELNAHKEVHQSQKEQMELLGNDRVHLQREVTKLEMDNRNLQARLNHVAATNKGGGAGGGGGGGGSLSSVNDKKRIQELEQTVEALQVQLAESRSKQDITPTFNKAAMSSSQAPPVYSSATSAGASSSRDRQKMAALPSRVRHGGPMKAQSMEEDLLNSRGNNALNRPGPNNMDQLGPLRAGVHQTRDDFQYGQRLHPVHEQRRSLTSYHNPATNAGFSRPSNAGWSASSSGSEVSVTPATVVGSMGPRPGAHAAGQYHHHHTAGVQSMARPGMNQSLPLRSSYAPPTPATVSGNSRAPATPYQLNIPPSSSGLTSALSPIHSPMTYSSGMSGPSSLPGSNLHPMPPPGGQLHPPHNAPLRAHHELGMQAQSNYPYGAEGVGVDNNGGNLAGQDSVEKDSPPSSLGEKGPQSLSLSSSLPLSRHNYPRQDRRSQQVPPNQGRMGGMAQMGGHGGVSKGLHSEQDLVMMMGRGTGRSHAQYQTGQGIGHSVSSGRMTEPRTTVPSSQAELLGRRPMQESSSSSSPKMQESSSSGSSVNISPNQLEAGIDDEIVAVAGQVGVAKGRGTSSDNAPIDPNLECPTCGLQFRIGQIQAFREHHSTCTRKMT